MFQRIYSIESTKIFKQSILRIELIIAAVLMIAIEAGVFAAMKFAPVEPGASSAIESMKAIITWPGALIQALSVIGAGGIGALLVIILTGAVVTQEYHWRTLQLWLGNGVPRLSYGLARFASLLLPVLLFILVTLFSGGLASLALSLVLDGSPHLDQINAAQLGLSILRTAYTLLPYAGLAFLLAVLTRSTVATIGIGLSFSLLFENLIAQILVLLGGGIAQAVKYLPMAMAGSLLRLNSTITLGVKVASKSAMPMLEPNSAAIGIAIYTVIFVALSCWILHRQDLPA